MSKIDDKGYLRDSYENFIHTSRYARWRDDLGRRETYVETVDRYMNYMKNSLLKTHGYTIPEDQYSTVREFILEQRVMPSMRAMMTAGPALDRDHVAGYNCSFLPVDDVRAFDETLYILMNGTGVGFSVEEKYVKKLPVVSEEFEESNTVIVVADSKEGWAKAYRELLSLLWSGQIPRWDTSKVRPAGERLKTFGGRASGPGPLEQLFQFSIDVFTKAAGRQLTSLECHDLVCKVAEVVVVGGVRRSALISLSDLSDLRMATAKAGSWWENNPQRALANNSVAYTCSPDMTAFMAEWKNLYDSKSGERGIFNRQAAKNQAKKNGRRDSNYDFGTNPCCVDGSTVIMTQDGPRRIDSLMDRPFDALVNGQKHFAPHGSWVSGIGDIYRLKTREGYELLLTPEHRILTASGEWQEAQNLAIGSQIQINNHRDNDLPWGNLSNYGDGYLMGLFIGDGNFTKGASENANWRGEVKVWKSESGTKDVMDESFGYASNFRHRSDWSGWSNGKAKYHVMNIGSLPLEYGILPEDKHNIQALELQSSEFHKGFLKGMFDCDGHVEGYKESDNYKGFSIRLGQSNYELLQVIQRMLLRLGMKSRIYRGNAGGMKMMPDGKGETKEYMCKPSYRLVISADDAVRYISTIGFGNSEKKAKAEFALSWRKKFYSKPFLATVESFEFVKRGEVWDAEVSEVHAFDANGIYAHNSEIILRPNQFCNLSEVVVRPEDTKEDLLEKVRAATILGTWQSTLTNFKYLRKIWKKNTEEERLLGVSLTGQLANPLLNGVYGDIEVTEEILEELKFHAVDVNAEIADAIGIPRSASITCVKPSGTVSQLVGVPSGMHADHDEFYIRTVRGDIKDPLTQFLIDSGVPYEPDVMKPNDTVVFSFPKKAGKNAVLRKHLTAIQHLNIWLAYQRQWCEHKPSITVSVREHEWMEVGAWVYKHFDEVSGISFLPFSEHTYKQAPYQSITEADYKDWLERMPDHINWELFPSYEQDDNTSGSQELACSANGGAGCEIVDIT